MIKYGFIRVITDINLYILIRDEGRLYFLVYVDDFFLVLKSLKLFNVRDLLTVEFEMKVFGDSVQLFGVQIRCDRGVGIIII